MENTTHTPGPWQVEQVTGGRYGTFLCITRGRGTDSIVQIHWHNRPINEEDKANARLIAAAPKLLEACRWMMRELCEAWDEPEQTAIPAEYRAAIAEATAA